MPTDIGNTCCVSMMIYTCLYFCSGFNPVWDEFIQFKVKVPELVLLRFSVYDSDLGSDDFLAQFTAPLTILRQGMSKLVKYLNLKQLQHIKQLRLYSNHLGFLAVLHNVILLRDVCFGVVAITYSK